MTIPVQCSVTQSFQNPVQLAFSITVPDTFNALGLADRQTIAFTAIVYEILHTQDLLGDLIGAIVATRVGGFTDMTAPFRPASSWILN